MRLNLQLSQKVLLLIAIPLVSQVVFVVILSYFESNAELEARTELRSKDIIATADQITNASQEAVLRLYEYNKDPQPTTLNRYSECMRDMNARTDELVSLTQDNPEEHVLALRAAKDSKEGKELGNIVLKSMSEGKSFEEKGLGQGEISPFKIRLFKISRHLGATIKKIGSLERQRTTTVSGRHFRGRVLPLLLTSVAINVLLALGLALIFNAGTKKRLKVLLENSLRLARGAPLQEPLDGRDELATLDATFHRMADALNEATRKELAIVENAVDVICSLDEKFSFITASPAALDVFGHHPNNIAGVKLATLVVPGDLERTLAEFNRVRVDANSASSFLENRINRKGQIVDVRWSAHWSATEKSFFCVVSDISVRKEIERIKQEFVSMMSHDLRTPLMSIQASLFLLSVGASGELNDSAMTNVQDAERNIAYIISLINSLIDVERIDSAKLHVNRRPTELAPILENAIHAVRSLAANKGITLECAQSEVEVDADSDRILQVIINLLSNALKFSPRGSSVIVAAVVVDESTVEIQIIDHGRGIPAEHLDAVFDRFKQVEIADATKYKGSGLGLAICKTIVDAHDGIIGVRSVEGEGTTFWFRLKMVETSVTGAPLL